MLSGISVTTPCPIYLSVIKSFGLAEKADAFKNPSRCLFSMNFCVFKITADVMYLLFIETLPFWPWALSAFSVHFVQHQTHSSCAAKDNKWRKIMACLEEWCFYQLISLLLNLGKVNMDEMIYSEREQLLQTHKIFCWHLCGWQAVKSHKPLQCACRNFQPFPSVA